MRGRRRRDDAEQARSCEEWKGPGELVDMGDSRKLIIIPAFNESANILATVERIRAEAPDFDFIVVNDCSTDETRKILVENGIPFLDLPVNLGIGGAVQTGYMYGVAHGYDMAVQVDGDGQHDPAFLERMAEQLERSGADMVIGSRFIEKEGFQSSAARRMGIRWFSWLIRRVSGARVTDPTSGLRMVGRRGMELFAQDYPRDYPEPETVVTLLMHGLRIEEIPVVMRERQGGTSSINLRRSVYYMIKVSLAILFERARKSS